MRAVLVLAFVVALAADARSASLPWTHARPMSPAAHHLLHLATRHSTLVRALLDDLEQTDVVVFLVFTAEPVTERIPDYMTFMTEAAGMRLVTIRLHQRQAPLLVQVPALAHELRHALELAEAADVRDRESFARLFATIGWEVGPGRFETARARITEDLVRGELAGHQHATPVVGPRHE